jgi:hypothetical protein
MAEIVQPVQGLVEAWRDEFPGSALQSGNWEVRKVGVGMSYSVASSKLTIATGVTSGDVLELISKPIRIKPPVRLFVSLDSISQRIANQEFSIELIRSDTLVDVFNTDGVGWFFQGTASTQADVRSVSQGDINLNNNVTPTMNTANPATLEIDLTTDEAWLYAGNAVDVITSSKLGAFRMTRKVPDPAQTYMVRIRAKNTGVPASTTNFVIDSVLVEDYTHLGVEIARSRGSSAAGEQLPVNVVSFTSTAAMPRSQVVPYAIWYDESVTPLAGAATFTGPGRDLMNNAASTSITNQAAAAPGRFRGWSDADQAGTLLAEVSRDNVTFRAVLSVPTATIDGRNIATFDIPVYTRYARVRYVNGATIQTSFTLGSQATAVS